MEPLQSRGLSPGSLDGSQAVGALCLGVGRRGCAVVPGCDGALGDSAVPGMDGPVTICVSQAAAANMALPRGTTGSHGASGTLPGSQCLPGCPQGAESDLTALSAHPPHPLNPTAPVHGKKLSSMRQVPVAKKSGDCSSTHSPSQNPLGRPELCGNIRAFDIDD